ncbi:hypothetical protein FRC12_004522 [Ceratobasidium sp. 428]|nr:hypothetical protein FRC12_004522 [Ceratobasidium sp. 428]
MALNNQGPIPESREQEPIFDAQSTVSLAFTPRALPYREATELSVGKHPQSIQEYDSSTSTCRSLALHGPTLHEFWTADNQIRAEVKKLISSRWFLAGHVLCWPDNPMPQLSVSSPEADWSKSGYLLFNEHLYVQAILCFDKAGRLLERDIAAAYQSRKEAWLLYGKSADQHAWHDSFAKAANSFLACATRADGKQQVVCYLRAAECFLQTNDWKLAADAFVAAEEFSLAARNFCRAGCFNDAMDLIENYADRIQKDFANEITEMARLQTSRQSRHGKAGLLNDPGKEPSCNLESHDSGNLRTQLVNPEHRGELSRVTVDNYDPLESIRLLSLSSADLLRQTVTQVLRGLWMTLPYGSAESQFANPAVTLLLEQASAFDLKMLDGDERRQLEMFQDIRSRKPDKIISLARANSMMSRSSEAILCFAHCARKLVSLRNATLSTFISNSALFLTYCNSLAALARTFQPSSANTQCLLGFEPVQTKVDVASEEEELHGASKFRVFSSSILFENVETVIGSVRSTPYVLGLTAVVLSEPDLTRLATKTILDKLKFEVQMMDKSANLASYTQPCLSFAIFGSCKLVSCGQQELYSHKLPNDIRQTHFNDRLRAHMLQALIIHSRSVEDDSSESQSYQWGPICKLYETLAPHFAPLGNVLCVDRAKILELERGLEVVSSWCQRDLHEFQPSHPLSEHFVSQILVLLELSYRVNRRSFDTYALKLHSMKLVDPYPDLLVHIPGLPGPDRSIIHHFIDFYHGRSDDALKRAIFAARHIVFRPLMIESNVLVHLFESIGRDVVLHARRWKHGIPGIFNGLLLPQSWALDIVNHPPQAVQRGWSIDVFFQSLYKTLEYMQTYDSNTSIAINLELALVAKDQIRAAIARSLTGSGIVHNALCSKFIQAGSWCDLVNSNPPRPTVPHVKHIIYQTIKPDLEKQLSLTYTPDQHQESTASLVAEPSLQGQPKVDPGGLNRQPEQKREIKYEALDPKLTGHSTADIFAGLPPTQIDYLAAVPRTQARCMLSSEDLTAGKQILFCYRRYCRRQRVAQRRSVRIIWRAYSRYLHRTRVTHTATDDLIRDLHNEYKKHAEAMSCPLFLAGALRRHKHVLLGLMPHVVVYLCQLEHVVQEHKLYNTQQLQKLRPGELEGVRTRIKVCHELSELLEKLIPEVLPGKSESALQSMTTLSDKVWQVHALRNAIIRHFGKDAIPLDTERHYELSVNIIADPIPRRSPS